MADGSRVAELLDDRPDLESPLREILAVDEEHDAWTFDDIPVESGAFGELVSRGVVEKEDGDYRLAAPDAVRRALEGTGEGVTSTVTEADAADGESGVSGGFSAPSADVDVDVNVGVDYRAGGLLAGTLAFVAIWRAFNVGSVFRDEHVVLGANDPYYYRYWVEQVLAGNVGLGELPGAVAKGEPLLVATLSVISRLFGGLDASGAVLAVYPVVGALIGALCLYVIALRLTADRRVGLAAIALLAITPGHALRTALGFADHHAFDYVWLAVTALSLVVLAGVRGREDLSRRTGLVALGLGIGVAGQALAWEAGPLLLVPVAGFVALRVLLDARAGRSPLVAMAPTLAGLALGALLAALGHTLLDWHTPAVAFAPGLLLAGGSLVTAVVEGLFRLDRSVREIAGIEALAGIVGVAAAWVAVPELSDGLGRGLDGLFRSDAIAETQALLSGDSFGFLLLFGFVLVLAFPALAWASYAVYAGDGDAPWLAASVYGWYFLALASIQVRFVGELALFTALFAGVGFVWLAARIDLAASSELFNDDDREFDRWVPDRPDRSTLAAFVVLFLLVGGLGMVQSVIKVEQVTTGEERYETAIWMAEYAEEHGLEGQETYVLSSWPDNRMYNYFVSGNSRSYSYAQSTYGEFVTATDPNAMYQTLRDRAAFAVLGPLDSNEQSIHAQLYDRYGNSGGGQTTTEHYRAVFVSPGGSYKVFQPVAGAILVGNAEPNATVEISANVSVPNDSFSYEQQASTVESGWFELRVPYPKEYEVGDTRISVTETQVTRGLSTADRLPRAHWSFDEGRGDSVFDSVGGNHGTARNMTWTSGVRNQSLQIMDGRYAAVPNPLERQDSRSFTLSVWFKTDPSVNYTAERPFPRIAAAASSSAYDESSGYQIAMSRGRLLSTLGDGSETVRLLGGPVESGEWHHAVLTWNGSTARLYRDGSVVGSGEYDGEVSTYPQLVFGASATKERYFAGTIDEGRYYNRSLSPAEVQELYSSLSDDEKRAESS